MRDYGKVAPTFWTGDTGRILRQMGRDEQLLALFLITGPNSNMIGLYHLPLAIICHYLKWDTKGALEGLKRISEGGFCHYDKACELIWIPEMAAHQLGEPLPPKDNRIKAIIKEWTYWRKSNFYMDFYRRYKDSYHLPKPSPLQGASRKPLRSQEQEQEQEQDILLPAKPASTSKADPDSLDTAPTPSDCDSETARTPSGDNGKPVGKKPREPNLLFDAIASVTGSDPKASAPHIGRVCKALRAADPPYTPDEVLRLPAVIREQGLDFTITLGSVEKYIGWVRHPPTKSGQAAPLVESLEEKQARLRREREQDDKAKAGCLSPEEYAQRRKTKNMTANLGAMPDES